MTSRSGRGRRQRVEAARRQARLALGKDPHGPDDYGAQLLRRAPASPPATPTPISQGSGVRALSLGEAAGRLKVSRSELEALIATGKIEALPTGFTRMIPTREVERLLIGAR